MDMRLINRLAATSTILAFCVVVLGAYVRLSDAGLGCPDWPGCYGQLLVPQSEQAVSVANEACPERPLEQAKAWKEMVHRYLASLLGLVIVVIAVCAWRARKRGFTGKLPYGLVVLVIFQSLLGMWTVTLLVKPTIVLLHLIGGFTTLALLFYLWLDTRSQASEALPAKVGVLAKVGLLVLIVQIMLGGWTSTNYAALSCPDFPTCQNQWWPTMDFADAFTLWRGTGVDYEGGVLGNASRVAIHVSHRIGAVLTALALLVLCVYALKSRCESPAAGRVGAMLLGLLLLQLALGIGNVVFHLPLFIATAHNAGAACLLLLLVYIIYQPTCRQSLAGSNL